MFVPLYELRFASDLLSLCTSSVFVFGFVLVEVYTRPHVTSYLFHCLSVFWLLCNQILLDLHHLGDSRLSTLHICKKVHIVVNVTFLQKTFSVWWIYLNRHWDSMSSDDLKVFNGTYMTFQTKPVKCTKRMWKRIPISL